MSVKLIIDDRIRQSQDECKLINQAFERLNFDAMDLPDELRIHWNIDDDVRTIGSPDRHYEVVLMQPDWPSWPLIGVRKSQLNSNAGIEEIKREFHWALGGYYLNRVKNTLRELQKVDEFSGVAS